MSNEDDYRSSDDEDYLPDGEEKDVEVSSGDECDEVAADEQLLQQPKKKRTTEEAKGAKVVINPVDELSEESRKNVQDIFRELIGEKNEPGPSTSTETAEKRRRSPEVNKSVEESAKKTAMITEVFDFAGDEIKIERVVSKDEAEAHEVRQQKKTEVTKVPQKRQGLSGALTLLAKKPKMSVLDKSNLDWKSFKQEEKLEEELTTHNRGKGGFLEKQAFLMKTDYAQFEKEKAMRVTARKNQ